MKIMMNLMQFYENPKSKIHGLQLKTKSLL